VEALRKEQRGPGGGERLDDRRLRSGKVVGVRRRVYGLLRFEVLARPDGTLEARGILGENLLVGSENGRAVCDPKLAQSCIADCRMQRNLLDYRPPSPRGPPP
jgi:hypothetical protein